MSINSITITYDDATESAIKKIDKEIDDWRSYLFGKIGKCQDPKLVRREIIEDPIMVRLFNMKVKIIQLSQIKQVIILNR